MTPLPCSPAATRKTSRSVTGSWSAIEAASASNSVTVASTMDWRTAAPPDGSSRAAASSRRATAASVAAALAAASFGSVIDVPHRRAAAGR